MEGHGDYELGNLVTQTFYSGDIISYWVGSFVGWMHGYIFFPGNNMYESCVPEMKHYFTSDSIICKHVILDMMHRVWDMFGVVCSASDHNISQSSRNLSSGTQLYRSFFGPLFFAVSSSEFPKMTAIKFPSFYLIGGHTLWIPGPYSGKK